MNTAAPSPATAPASALKTWWRISLAGGALLTAFDAFLLQQKKAFFTGGFLAVDHATSLGDVLGFLAASLMTDVAVAGAGVAGALWIVSRVRLTPEARSLSVLTMALAPLVVADFVNYRLAAYLGDAFDLSLMFDLTGRQPGEMLAIAAPHLLVPTFAAVGMGTLLLTVVWAVNRYRPRLASAARVERRMFSSTLVLLLFAVVGTAAVRARSDVMDNGLRRKPAGKVLGWIVATATDLDRDGYGASGFIPDSAPFDPAVFPYAVDVPGNGVDENGVGGDLPAGVAHYAEPVEIPGPWIQKPDLVLFVLESFRADSVGAMLNGRPVTPVLDALAAAGISAPASFSHNGYTTQSRFHTLSGSLADLRTGRTLIDDFKANGYEVAYFSGQDESFGGVEFGFERADVAYDARQDRARRYSTFTTPGSLAVPFDVVQERVGEFLRRRSSDRPLFLYVNFHDTHYPYHHAGIRPLLSQTRLAEAEIGPARAHDLHEMYLNTAANVDAAIGATLKMVRAHLPLHPAVIVTSDHGESLFDERFLGHGYALNDVQTRIPLIAAGIPLAIEQPFGQAELRDAIATALSAAPDTPARVRSRDDKQVFQYLGSIDRPRQVALTGAAGRLIYDFRTRKVRLESGPWLRPGDLDADGTRRWLELLHFWERLVLARRSITRAPIE